HPGVRLGAGLLADLLVRTDVAAEDAGERPADALRDGLGADDDAAHDAEVLGHVVALQVVGRRDGDACRHGVTSRGRRGGPAWGSSWRTASGPAATSCGPPGCGG